ncbi:hypothetical protein QWY86_15460 [Pedobacter aquatilis]|uniref:toxin-antitoxin system YwqK family antitoxin n=1 Tax=Pedobacter aquatilis TaxID=351343 RepID=UPI0025B5326D|nr:hypothetical protein [Pedobacter aquatilis]MDN3588080.1 hypothetical protein [Pedobacter aquatilis]
MKVGTLILVVSMGLLGAVQAQSARDFLDAADYRHTITMNGYKQSFFTRSSGVKVFVDRDKTYYWYANNTISSTQGGFDGKLLHGQYNEFYADKNLKVQGNFENGLKVAIWKNWSDGGLLKEIIEFKNGVMDGNFFRYNSHGLLEEEGRYKLGKLHGKVRRYRGKDSIEVLLFKRGELQLSPDSNASGVVKRFLKKIPFVKKK